MVTPIVSVIMANYNAADFIAAALKSVMAQSISQIEIILSDDASTDGSVKIARDIAASEPRLMIIETDKNAGPAAARNRALDAATGKWIAIVDSDDIIHPHRLERMISFADTLETDAIADDLTYMVDGVIRPEATLLEGAISSDIQKLTARSFVASTPKAPKLGYLKPMIRRAAIGNLRYREDIRIGEDHDFYVRFLLNGGQMQLLPQSYYLYRRHPNSLSYRLRPNDVQTMIAVQDDLLTSYPDLPDDVKADFVARRLALQEPLAFETLVQNIKTRQFGNAIFDLIRKPALLTRLGSVMKDHLVRRFSTPVDEPGIRVDPNQWTVQDWSANLKLSSL